MVEEEYSDDTFEQDPDDTMDVAPDDFRQIVLYRELDGLSSHSPFRQKVWYMYWIIITTIVVSEASMDSA